MSTIVIDRAVIADVAAETGMSEAQLLAWYQANYEDIKAIRFYIQSRRTTEPLFIEQFAVPGRALDPAFVQQVLTLLRIGNMILILDPATPPPQATVTAAEAAFVEALAPATDEERPRSRARRR